MSLHPSRCLICGSGDSVTVCRYHAPDAYERAVGVGEPFFIRAWVRCAECGFHYSQYSRDPDVLDRIYDEAYRAANAPWRSRSVRETFAAVTALPYERSETKQRVHWIKEQLESLARQGRCYLNGAPCDFLDVGGGNAIFAHEFKDARWQPFVVDPSEEGAALCHDLDIPYVRGALENASFNRDFALVAMTYVLEHLRDPLRALRAARRHVGPAGALFIEVPDAACFEDTPPDDDIFNACHLWMFGPGDLSRLLWSSGFEPVAEESTISPRGHHALKVLAVPA